jgi:hypothetical protein
MRKNIKKYAPLDGRGDKKDKLSDVVMVMLPMGEISSLCKLPRRLKDKGRKSE